MEATQCVDDSSEFLFDPSMTNDVINFLVGKVLSESNWNQIVLYTHLSMSMTQKGESLFHHQCYE